MMCTHTPIVLAGLDEEISDRDLAIIARDHVNDWKSLRPFLGLNRPKEKEIVQSYPTDYGKQKQECLEVWKEMKGKEATYSALIRAAEDAKFQSLADGVRAVLMKAKCTHSHDVCVFKKYSCVCTYIYSGVAASSQLRADGDETLPHVSISTPQQVPPNHSKCGFILGFAQPLPHFIDCSVVYY